MTFLAPILLFALPLAALPVIIHLIHLHRRRTVQWAAMMFLLAAQRMNKGLSRLRQWLILAFRVLTIAALVFVICRPLAGGWLGLTGGVPDTVLVLVDRSASMEQQNPATGLSKRAAGLRKLADAMQQTYSGRSRLVLIDSATLKPQALEKAAVLADLPQTAATDTAADVPALMQGALDYITTNHTGRTDVWVSSDLRQTDWDATSGRWEALRGGFTSLQGVRFHVLTYPQAAPENLGVTVERVTRRETADKAELLLDLRIVRSESSPQPLELPLRFVINGASTTTKVTLKDNQLVLQGHTIPIDRTVKRGWGRVELPADLSPADNAFHFVFDEPPVLKSVIVSDDTMESGPLQAALSASVDPTQKTEAIVLPTRKAAEIPWDDAALIIWHAPIPKGDDVLAGQLTNHLAAGRPIIFLPPDKPDDQAFLGLQWGAWQNAPSGKPATVEWWRNDTGLLANTRAGTALPLGELEVVRHCEIVGEAVPIARLNAREPLMVRAAGVDAGPVWFLGTLPGPNSSSLARDGVVMFAMLHRALAEGATTLGKAQQRIASRTALGNEEAASKWRPVGVAKDQPVMTVMLPLRAGVLESGDKLVALNRPANEDQAATLGATTLDELFAGLDYRRLEDTVENSRGLTSEVWRTFLIAAALFLLGEALLCMPARREQPSPSPAS